MVEEISKHIVNNDSNGAQCQRRKLHIRRVEKLG